MNKMISILALLISVSVHAHAEEIKCKCDEVPFKPDPPCVKACVVAVMKNADMSTLAENVKLTKYQEFSLERYRSGPPVADGPDKDALIQKSSLNQVEKNLYSLPGNQLRKIVLTVPPADRTIFIPADKVDYYKWDNPQTK